MCLLGLVACVGWKDRGVERVRGAGDVVHAMPTLPKHSYVYEPHSSYSSGWHWLQTMEASSPDGSSRKLAEAHMHHVAPRHHTSEVRSCDVAQCTYNVGYDGTGLFSVFNVMSCSSGPVQQTDSSVGELRVRIATTRQGHVQIPCNRCFNPVHSGVGDMETRRSRSEQARALCILRPRAECTAWMHHTTPTTITTTTLCVDL